MTAGDIHNHNGSICKATKNPCPFGENGHSKDVDSFVEYQVQEKGVNEETLRSAIADGVPLKDAVEVAKTGLANGAKKLKKLDGPLVETPEGISRFQAYKNQWASQGNAELGSVYAEALAARDTPGTYDGAWVKPQEDGGIMLPAGDYVYAPADALEAYSDEEEDEEEDGNSAIDTWRDQAKAQTPPGAVGGAYIGGKPALLFTAMDMGRNHGYDGEVLIPASVYEELESQGYFADEEPTPVTVKKDTIVYGYLGNPKDAPEGLYDCDAEELSEEAEEVYSQESFRKGTLFNHPAIEIEEM